MIESPTPLYRVLSGLLLSGAVLSVALMALGYALLLARHGAVDSAWMPLGAVVPHALAGDPRGILDVGVLVLLATPTLRVVTSISIFTAERQRRYALLATAVLLLLALSFTLALLRH